MNDQGQVEGCPHGELAVGWALRSLEPAEESLVAVHLPGCPACRSLASQTEEVGAMLGLSVPELVPSAELEQRILGVTGIQRNAPVAPLTPPSPAQPTSAPSGFPPVRWIAAAAVILVAAVMPLAVWIVRMDGQLNQAQREVRAMSEALQSAADPGTVLVPLVTKDGHRVGMVIASGGRLAVAPAGLPSNRVADQTYVLWGLAGQTPIALAVFDVSGESPEIHAVSSAAGRESFAGYAISLEPGRRAPAVPSHVVASGQVTS
jgi:Anti-sigma-K factor rskA